MKKYFIAVAAMAFLVACSGKQAQKDVPVEVEEEEFAIMSAACLLYTSPSPRDM